MRLLLVRHAEALPLSSDPGATDFHRPLTVLGRTQAQTLAQVIKNLGIPVTVIVTSPLVRAIETAERLLELTPGKEFVVTERLACGELKPKKLSKLAFELGGSPLLVGHMPDIADYANWLIGAESGGVDFDKAAIACINCRYQIAKGGGQLEWLVPPNWYLPMPS